MYIHFTDKQNLSGRKGAIGFVYKPVIKFIKGDKI
jgi:hypothetical protein